MERFRKSAIIYDGTGRPDGRGVASYSQSHTHYAGGKLRVIGGRKAVRPEGNLGNGKLPKKSVESNPGKRPGFFLENFKKCQAHKKCQACLKGQEDYEMDLELLKKYKEQYGFKLFSFMLMPGQLNLLMEVKEGVSISAIRQGVTSGYPNTKYFNNRYQREGQLFQERFRSVVVEKKPYLVNMVSYIHLIPLAASLAKSPEDCIYSSHLLYLYNTQDQADAADKIKKILDLEAETVEVLGALNQASYEKKDYADFIAWLTREEIEGLRKKLERANILGSGQFREKIQSLAERKTAPSQEKNFPLASALSASLIVLLNGVGLGILYMRKNGCFIGGENEKGDYI